ncbi:MAG: fasciclin domain-containing protein [Chitinophagaceae bacterium]
MKFFKKIILLALPFLIGAVAITGCNDKENVTPADTVDTLLSTTGNLSIFKAALEKTGLNSFSKGGGPFTFFAPSDDAFKATGINTIADLNAIDNNLLAQVLSYHIMTGSRTLIEIPSGPNAPAASIGTLSFYASKNANGAFINGSKIIQADIKGSNGIIHVIDKVLTPPFTNLLATLAANTNFKLLVQGINKAALGATFSGTTVYTVFAPTNAAFVAGGYDSTTIANLSGAALTTFTNTLRYHLVAGRMFSSEFKAGTVKTVQGSNVTISFSGGTKIKGVTNPTPASVTATDFLTSNGIIHTIDGVLKF